MGLFSAGKIVPLHIDEHLETARLELSVRYNSIVVQLCLAVSRVLVGEKGRREEGEKEINTQSFLGPRFVTRFTIGDRIQVEAPSDIQTVLVEGREEGEWKHNTTHTIFQTKATLQNVTCTQSAKSKAINRTEWPDTILFAQVESAGTTLSTDWKDVGSKYVAPSAPSGMEMKKYGQ